MRILNFIKTFPIVALLCGCQSEAPLTEITPKRVFSVKATLPATETTRTHVTYGNPNIDEELFRWHLYSKEYPILDYIWVFNLSNESGESSSIQLETTNVDGNTAIFESLNSSDFQVKKGDVFFVSYWATTREKNEDNNSVFKIEISKKPQIIVEEPLNDGTHMSFMQSSLKMYDIVTADKDNELPDIHFKHLAAIMRVTLHNETGKDILPKSLEII